MAEEPAADVLVRLRQRFADLLESEVVGLQARGIDLDMDLRQESAERDHVGDSRHLAKLRRDRPLELRPELVHRVAIAGHDELVDLAKGCVLGAEVGGEAIGQIGGVDALGDTRACLERVDVVVERQIDQRQPEQALGAHRDHVRGAVERALEG